MNSSTLEGSVWVRGGGGGLTAGTRQTGHGESDRSGGEEGPGLEQRDPDGETGGGIERGETGREEEGASIATKESLLGEAEQKGMEGSF